MLVILLIIYDLKYWFIVFKIYNYIKSVNIIIIVLFRKFGSIKLKIIFMKNDEENDNNKLINVEINSGYVYFLFEIRFFILLLMINLFFFFDSFNGEIRVIIFVYCFLSIFLFILISFFNFGFWI